MKNIVFKLPPTNLWLRFMLGLQSEAIAKHLQPFNPRDPHDVYTLQSHWYRAAKDGFLVWNHAKVWYLGVGVWRIGGYSHDGSDADEVMARVLSKMLEGDK